MLFDHCNFISQFSLIVFFLILYFIKDKNNLILDSSSITKTNCDEQIPWSIVLKGRTMSQLAKCIVTLVHFTKSSVV